MATAKTQTIMYRPLSEVLAKLQERIGDDKLKKVEKVKGQTFTYIAWNDAARQLDDIFGPFGWAEEVVKTDFDSTNGVYAVTRQLVGYAMAGEEVVSIRRQAIGRAVAQPSREGGLTPQSHDIAIAAADSDSFSRASKKLGDAFGLFLYDKEDPAHQASSAPQRSYDASAAPRSSSPHFALSEKQVFALGKKGYSNDDMARIRSREDVDAAFAGTFPKGAKAAAASVPAGEDFPF